MGNDSTRIIEAILLGGGERLIKNKHVSLRTKLEKDPPKAGEFIKLNDTEKFTYQVP